MKIILKEDIANLGYKDDVVEVKSGYGRNYLIPQGKAVIASPGALKQLAEVLKQRAHKIAKIKADAEAKAATLEGVALTITAKTSANGSIYGSVGSAQVAEELAKLGHEVDRKIIVVKDAVKEVGSYKALVKLHKEVSVEIPFEVVAEEGDVLTFSLKQTIKDAGMFKYAFRVYPNNADLPHRQDFAYMKWI